MIIPWFFRSVGRFFRSVGRIFRLIFVLGRGQDRSCWNFP